MPRIDIKGKLIPNDYKWYYDTIGEDTTCPRDIQKAIGSLSDGGDLDVYINSPGGLIDVGSEIYTLLRQASERSNLKIHIVGQACSAASVVAMAGYCEMSPSALMMIHCVSTTVSGNHNDFEHAAKMLRTADNAMCAPYVLKTGRSEEEMLSLMEEEKWFTASEAKEYGLIDAIMFTEEQDDTMLVAGPSFKLPTKEQMAQVKKLAGLQDEKPDDTAVLLQKKMQMKLNAMKRPILQNTF